MSRMCHSGYRSLLHTHSPHRLSASWKTVSMWQSSLRWKRSRSPGAGASSPSSPSATSGSHQLHSVCQPGAACEATPRSAVSHQRSPGCFGFLLMEFHHPGFFRNNALNHSLVLRRGLSSNKTSWSLNVSVLSVNSTLLWPLLAAL